MNVTFHNFFHLKRTVSCSHFCHLTLYGTVEQLNVVLERSSAVLFIYLFNCTMKYPGIAMLTKRPSPLETQF